MGKSIKINKLGWGGRSQERVDVDESILQESLSQYEKGQYVDACRTALQAGPLQLWRGA